MLHFIFSYNAYKQSHRRLHFFFSSPFLLSRKFIRGAYILIICTKEWRLTNDDWRRRRRYVRKTLLGASQHEVVAIINWFFLSLTARPEESHPMRGKCWKTKRGGRLLPPGIGHKDEKKEEEKQRMTWRACSILPTMLLFSRCYVALFLDDGTGGRAAYAPLFVPTYPVYRCLLPVALSLFLLSSYGIPREFVSSTSSTGRCLRVENVIT